MTQPHVHGPNCHHEHEDAGHVHGPNCQHDHHPQAPMRNELKDVGRNDPCPCGSGKKFKKCHAT